MTTDSWPKLRAREVGEGRIVGVAKGAGMIEPNLATMLVFLLTDLDMRRESLRRILPARAAAASTASASTATRAPATWWWLSARGASRRRRRPVPRRRCWRSAAGWPKTSCATARGSATSSACAWRGPAGGAGPGAGKAVVNSPLVKSAVFGNDPNVGRILSSMGDFLGTPGGSLDFRRLTGAPGRDGAVQRRRLPPGRGKEQRLAPYLRECASTCRPGPQGLPPARARVEMEVRMGRGERTLELWAPTFPTTTCGRTRITAVRTSRTTCDEATG